MTVEPVENKKPQHVRFVESGLKWDWRKENAVELILLVFLLSFFFTLPRAGCGVTDVKTAQAGASAPKITTGASVNTPPARGMPEG